MQTSTISRSDRYPVPASDPIIYRRPGVFGLVSGQKLDSDRRESLLFPARWILFQGCTRPATRRRGWRSRCLGTHLAGFQYGPE